MNRYCLFTAVLSVAAASMPANAQVDRSLGRDVPASIEALRLDTPVTILAADPSLDRESGQATGPQQVIVRLSGAPVARGGSKSAVLQEQADFLKRFSALPSMRVIAQVHMVLNAVFLEVDSADLPALAADAAVQTVRKVANYELDLSETVPYIGASAVQSLKADGKHVSVAVLDSGVDYTHAAFGGAGTLAAYEDAYGTDTTPFGGDLRHTVLDGQFPSGRVVGGFDFVGEDWPFGALAPDPDPIPANDTLSFGGHGTHVADIIGGSGGVAPKVDLYAVKVCASYASSCSGIALIHGMDFAVDPNGDGDPSDAVDVINMSLGANYGSPFNDDLSAAVDNAHALGVLTVAAAGNGSDKPYVQGTPAGAPTAISVAQTHVPSSGFQLIDVGALTSIPAVFQSWSAPPAAVISAPVEFGGAFGSSDGCSTGIDPNSTAAGTEPYPPGTFSGEIVLVDRGTCNFSVKIFNIQRGGGSAGIIGLVAPGAPFNGAFGVGGPFSIPGYMISQADSLAIQGVLPAAGTIDPANVLSQGMSMVSSSSRGPQIDDNRIKPEIGAPGASVSAQSGTGTGTAAFGGTSGASPMVAGSAALLLDCRNDPKSKKSKKPKKSDITLVEAKSLLMNTAEIDILTDVLTGDLAEVSRIGGGEVRVDWASVSAASAWSDDDPASGGALSFGQVDVVGIVEITKTVRVRNRSSKKITYDITPTFRTPGPEGSGAVTVSTPSSIKVKGNPNGDPKKDAVFDVTLTIDGSLLPGNFMNSGSQGNNPVALTANEFDGYLSLTVKGGKSKKSKKSKKSLKSCKKIELSADPIHVAWHVLPRRAADVVPSATQIAGGGFPEVIGLDNQGIGTAQNDAYSLIALSPDVAEGGAGAQAPTPDIASVGVNTFITGSCSSQFIWAFAVNTHERQRHLVQPVSHQIALDTNQDGATDYVVLNRDVSFNNVTDGRQLSWVFDLSAGSASAFFFAEHATNTGNTALYVCGEQLGMSPGDILATNVDITSVFAQDFYFGGPGDEAVFPGTLTITPLGEQYFGLPSDVSGNTNDAAGLLVFDFGPFPGNTPELGVMMFSNGDRGAGARGGATEPTETLVFTAPGVVVP